MLFSKKPATLPDAATALPGRATEIPTAGEHFIFHRDLKAAAPAGYETAVFAIGCFWGAERKFWEQDGVWMTASGYAGGITPNPTYEEVCSGRTGHSEAVRVVFDPARVTYAELVKLALESHDPTQGMRQGNDIGTQYRSAIYTTSDAQADTARQMVDAYQAELAKAGHRAAISTEIAPLKTFYYAEDYHQQYLAKNPAGYCGIGGTGVSCPIGLSVSQG
jgi:peptide-methionine (S)-S-oxide reductase